MIGTDDLTRVEGATVLSQDGDKIGTAKQVYLDDDSGRPAWVTVNTGLFGTSESFIPLEQADLSGDELRVPYAKDKVKDAPRVGDDGHISRDQEAELYSYYGLGGGYSDDRSTGTTGTYAGTTAGTDDRTGTVGHDTSGPTTDHAMTRSEEQLRVGTEDHEAGRVRLRKYVTTEQQTVQVPVSKEEVRLEREPITEANRGDAHDGPAISEEEHEVVLHEERPVVEKEAVPVERVRLEKETHTDTETVSGEVRQEHITTDGDDDTTRR
jgi:uncharacterized protein (TIGR02271 family)